MFESRRRTLAGVQIDRQDEVHLDDARQKEQDATPDAYPVFAYGLHLPKAQPLLPWLLNLRDGRLRFSVKYRSELTL